MAAYRAIESDHATSANDPLRTLAVHRIIASMLLRDYFAGQRVRLRSPMSARAIAERINEAAGSALWPFNSGVVGGVWLGHIRLQYRSSLFEYNAKPILTGSVRDALNGSTLELRYRAPLWVYCFYVVWYLFLTFAVAAVLGNGWAPQVTVGDKAMVISIFAILLVAPVGMHAYGTRRSEEDLADLLDFLSQHAQASR